MTLPIDQTNLNAAAANQVPSLLIQSALNIAAIRTATLGVNEVYNFATGLVSSSTLSRLGVVNVMDYNASGSAVAPAGSITSGSKTLTILAPSVFDFVAGQGISLQGTFEVASLLVTAGASSSANCTVTLNGVGFNVALTSGNTATQVATAIRAATFAGWTTGGSGTTVTFTSLNTGVKTDAAYSAGTTSATGTMSTTTQGIADQVSTVSSTTGLVITLADNATRTISSGTILHDDTTALQAVRDYIATFENPPTVVFPAGIYQYSVSPNWAIQNARFVNEGTVRLRYTGTGNAVILDGIVGTNSNVYNMMFGQFIIEAPSTALSGVYMKCVHHSEINVKVRGCGSASAGMFLYFGVCNKIKLTVTTNEETWYLGARPYYGLRLGLLISGQLPSYNIFENCTIEGTIEGANLADSLGNIFLGGTVEGCFDNGVTLTTTAGLNKFIGMDFEANVGDDIVCAGFENEFIDCDSTKIVDFLANSVRNTIRGGSYKSITFEVSATYNLVDGVKYNRQLFDGTTGTITDNGTYNRLVNNMDVKNNKIGNRPAAVTAITLTGSVHVYTNQTGNDERILLSGGTITSLDTTHGSGGDSLATTTPQWVTLGPADTLSIGYSSAPTVKKYTA